MPGMETPPIRKALPWCVLFGVLGAGLGIVECAWLGVAPIPCVTIAAVFVAAGWGFGFDVARQWSLPWSTKRILMFCTLSAGLFVLAAALCGAAGWVLNVFLSDLPALSR